MDIEISIQALATATQKVVRLPIKDRLTLGRGPENPVLLDGPQISRQHITIAAAGTQLSLWNLSVNGTAVNGTQVPTGIWHPLREGDIVQLPGYNLSFLLLGEKPAAAAAPLSFLASVTPTEKAVLALFLAALTVAGIFWTL